MLTPRGGLCLCARIDISCTVSYQEILFSGNSRDGVCKEKFPALEINNMHNDFFVVNNGRKREGQSCLNFKNGTIAFERPIAKPPKGVC